MTSAVDAILGREENARQTAAVSGYFAQARLTRQQSRDQALSLLETAASSETATAETIDAAMKEITAMANWSLLESRVENELLESHLTAEKWKTEKGELPGLLKTGEGEKHV